MPDSLVAAEVRAAVVRRTGRAGPTPAGFCQPKGGARQLQLVLGDAGRQEDVLAGVVAW
jgi:hypothetical protein